MNAKLKSRLDQSGLHCAELARRMKVTRTTIALLINGRLRLPGTRRRAEAILGWSLLPYIPRARDLYPEEFK